MTDFKFPSIYHFPPFFTKQIHLDTTNTQLSLWCKLILEYCKFYHIWVLNVDGVPVKGKQDDIVEDEVDIPEESIFHNKEINRTLRPEFIKEIMAQLCSNGNLEMINSNEYYIYYKTIEEMSNSLLQWIENTGQQNTILTLYELSNGELNKNEFFHNINQHVLLKIINSLVLKKRAVILKDENDKIMGVKIQ